jgi:transposase
MNQIGIAYGQGLYTLAKEEGLEQSILQQLKVLQACFEEQPEYGKLLSSHNLSKEERIQIVRECIANGCNYGECAIKYNVSYQQVYGWVKRFKELGEAGLEDRRGRRKVDQEPRSEVEELKIKMAQLEHELYMTKMERDLLKKVKELERKELYRK